MFAKYNETHSITFGKLSQKTVADVGGTGRTFSYVDGKNTWADWKLIPSQKPIVNPPPPIFKHIEVPGMYGVLDLSRILTGRMNYQNRTGSWEFVIDHDRNTHFETAYSEIMNYLHGENLVCVLSDDPAFYYEGSFSVSSPKSNAGWTVLSIDYNLYPFKRHIQDTSEPWLWDPFNFENGVITEGQYAIISVPAYSSKDLNVYACEEAIKPLIYCDTAFGVTVTINGRTQSLKPGWFDYPGIILSRSDNKDFKTVRFTNSLNGTTRVGIKYRGGEL